MLAAHSLSNLSTALYPPPPSVEYQGALERFIGPKALIELFVKDKKLFRRRGVLGYPHPAYITSGNLHRMISIHLTNKTLIWKDK
jgi:hypothetical protein